MKALVVGYGSIGQRHVNNLLAYPNMEILILTKRKKIQPRNKRCKIYHSIQECIEVKPDFAVICNETRYHLDTALKLAQNNIHLFIEKPLSNSTNKIQNLLDTVENKHLITLVGCNMRFHQSLKKIKQLIVSNKIGKILSVKVESGSFLPDWHPYEDYRRSYASKKILGGGVILTCIHELDYLCWFFGLPKKIISLTGKLSDLQIDVEDYAAMILTFDNNIMAEIHLDYFQQPDFRECKIIGTKGTIYWNSTKNLVEFYDIKSRKWSEILKIKNYDRNSMYKDEMAHFIVCIKNKHETINPVSEATKILKAALIARNSGKTKQGVFL